MFTNNLKWTSLLAIFIFTQSVQAAVVTQIKGAKVLIDNESDEIAIGEEYYLLNAEEKQTGVIRITSVKSGKSIGTIIKGKASGQDKLKPKAADAFSEKVTDDEETEEVRPIRWNSRKLSVLVHTLINSMTAKESDGQTPVRVEDVAMSGSTFGAGIALDLPLRPWFEVRLLGAYEPFDVKGTASINGCNFATSPNCDAKINYLTAGAYGRFNLQLKRLLFWGAIGATTKFPISKSSTALKVDDITMTGTYNFAVGLDYFITNKSFIPISAEQQFFLDSETVKASQLALRLGYGWAF